MLVMFVRFVASAHIFTREDHFLPFILGTMDNCIGVDDFRRRYVEVMGEESDHIQVVALSEAFRVRRRHWHQLSVSSGSLCHVLYSHHGSVQLVIRTVLSAVLVFQQKLQQ